jgi:hypothetical protein
VTKGRESDKNSDENAKHSDTDTSFVKLVYSQCTTTHGCSIRWMRMNDIYHNLSSDRNSECEKKDVQTVFKDGLYIASSANQWIYLSNKIILLLFRGEEKK